MNFWQAMSGNLWSMTVDVGFTLWMSHILLGRIPRHGRMHVFKCFMASVFVIVLFAFLGSACYVAGVFYWKYQTGILLWKYFSVLCMALFLRFLYRAPMKDCCIDILTVEILYSYGDYLSQLYSVGIIYNLTVPEERRRYLFWILVVVPACLVLCGFVIHMSGIGRIYRQWIGQEDVHKGILLLLFSYPAIYRMLQIIVNGRQLNGSLQLLPLALLFMIHVFLLYAGRNWQQKQEITAQQNSLKQQTIYIEQLEQIQSELRRFRHDFKNMTAGMYLQAKEGDPAAVEAFIQNMTEDFDRQVGSHVQLVNELGNVRMMEVKGLLMDKMIRMKREGIRFELEVMFPLDTTRMRSTDLCRCLGILLDNAVEEAQGKKDGWVRLMISSPGGDVTVFRITNSLYSEPALHLLGKDGYTTKGEGHGTGLESYRKILDRYDFIFNLTAARDGCFVQEFTIHER